MNRSGEGAPVRLQKYLSRTGIASRREAEKLILQGRVRVNDRTVSALGTKVDPVADRVEVDGQVVRWAATRWIALHKPAGVVTTRSDPQGRETVYGLLPGPLRELRYVGRLDLDTEGLLLLTNEGDLLHRLTHPSSQVEREYLVRVKGRVDDATIRELRAGVELEDGIARAHEVKRTEGGTTRTTLRLVLLEGRKREVRRLLEAVGHPVVRLKRIRFGPVRLGGLPAGRWRELKGSEIEALEASVPGED